MFLFLLLANDSFDKKQGTTRQRGPVIKICFIHKSRRTIEVYVICALLSNERLLGDATSRFINTHFRKNNGHPSDRGTNEVQRTSAESKSAVEGIDYRYEIQHNVHYWTLSSMCRGSTLAWLSARLHLVVVRRVIRGVELLARHDRLLQGRHECAP